MQLTAPSTAGTYYYGACVDALADESDTTNNCSPSVQVDVSEPATGGEGGTEPDPPSGGGGDGGGGDGGDGDGGDGSGGGTEPEPEPESEPEPEAVEVAILGVPDVAVAGASYELTAQSGADALAYAWSVDSGTIEPDDAQMVVWTAPETAGVAWIRVDATRAEDGATAGQSAYVRVEVADPDPDPEPVPALPLLGQLLLASLLLGAGRFVIGYRRPQR